MLIPDENDALSYNQLLVQLWELYNVELHPVTTLFSPGTAVCYIDDTWVVRFGTREEYEILFYAF